MVWVKVAESCCPFKNRASSACFKGKLSRAMRVVSMTSVLASLQLVRRAVSVLQGLYIYIFIWLYIYIISLPCIALHCIHIPLHYVALHYVHITYFLWVADLSPHMFKNTVKDDTKRSNSEAKPATHLHTLHDRAVAHDWRQDCCHYVDMFGTFFWSLGVSYPLFPQMEMDGNGRCIHGRTFFSWV